MLYSRWVPLLFFKTKKHMQKHFDITCFLLLFRNKKNLSVLQNEQIGTFMKFNKNNNGIIDLY